MPGEREVCSVVTADDLSLDEPVSEVGVSVIRETGRLAGEIVDCVMACG
jgi:hypothetical protein